MPHSLLSLLVVHSLITLQCEWSNDKLHYASCACFSWKMHAYVHMCGRYTRSVYAVCFSICLVSWAYMRESEWQQKDVQNFSFFEFRQLAIPMYICAVNVGFIRLSENDNRRCSKFLLLLCFWIWAEVDCQAAKTAESQRNTSIEIGNKRWSLKWFGQRSIDNLWTVSREIKRHVDRDWYSFL